MASLGHVAIGMVVGRAHGGTGRARQAVSVAAFGALALLPDADVFWLALGVPDRGAIGHRGASHALLTALALGLLAVPVARRLRLPAARTAMLVVLAVASHGILDALTACGRGIPLFWPLTDHRFTFPVRPIPDAPKGLAFFGHRGLHAVMVEAVYFFPCLAWALWPRRAASVAIAQRVPDPAATAGGAAATAAVPAMPVAAAASSSR